MTNRRQNRCIFVVGCRVVSRCPSARLFSTTIIAEHCRDLVCIIQTVRQRRLVRQPGFRRWNAFLSPMFRVVRGSLRRWLYSAFPQLFVVVVASPTFSIDYVVVLVRMMSPGVRSFAELDSSKWQASPLSRSQWNNMCGPDDRGTVCASPCSLINIKPISVHVEWLESVARHFDFYVTLWLRFNMTSYLLMQWRISTQFHQVWKPCDHLSTVYHFWCISYFYKTMPPFLTSRPIVSRWHCELYVARKN